MKHRNKVRVLADHLGLKVKQSHDFYDLPCMTYVNDTLLLTQKRGLNQGNSLENDILTCRKKDKHEAMVRSKMKAFSWGYVP